MRLYYFTSKRYGLEAIQKRCLKVARINELNDPFELLSPVLDTRDQRAVFRHWRDEMSERFGLLCMSRGWNHPLLWAHYGDRSQGVCLGFELQARRRFNKVEYVKERPTLADMGLTDLARMPETVMTAILHRKFDSWSYEAEYRSFVRLTDKDPSTGLYFADFKPDLKLVEVIVGYRSTASRAEVQDALGDLVGVEAFPSRPGFHKFEVVRNRDDDAWV